MINLGSSKDKGKVSVVVTFKDLDNVAGRMLNSLIEQTYKNLEIICVDDHSTDNTLEILNEFAKNDDRIVVLSNSESFGVSKSRNIGIDRATGKYLIVVDGDDEMIFDGIEHMVNAFDENTDCVVAGFKQVTKDGDVNIIMPDELAIGSPKDIMFYEKLMRYSNKSDVCCYTRMYLRDKFKARYKEGCNYGEHLLVAMQNLQYLDNIKMKPLVIYNYSPYPYPKNTMSNENKGKEFDLIKQVAPEVQDIVKTMFPNNKFALYLSSFCLITAIFAQARTELLSGKTEDEVVQNISNNLSDSLMEETFIDSVGKTIEDNEILDIIKTKDAEELLNTVTSQDTVFETEENKQIRNINKIIFVAFVSKTPTTM